MADEGTPHRRRSAPHWIAAIAIGAAIVGVFATWTTAGPVSLNGTQGPNDGWLVLIVAAVALAWIRSFGRGSWPAVAAVLGASLVIAWVALEDWLENRDALGADVGYGLLLVLAASVALGISAVVRGVRLTGRPRPAVPRE